MVLSIAQTTTPLQILPGQTLARLNGGANADDGSGGMSKKQMAAIDSASHQFEAVFMSEMLKPMFNTVKTDSLFGGGQAEDTYKGLMVQQLGKQIASNGGLGLAKFVKAEMIKLQEGANKA